MTKKVGCVGYHTNICDVKVGIKLQCNVKVMDATVSKSIFVLKIVQGRISGVQSIKGLRDVARTLVSSRAFMDLWATGVLAENAMAVWHV
jgi:hypothetical protein